MLAGKEDIMTKHEIEDKIIELVAREENCTPESLRADLLKKGKELPIDSEALVAISLELGELYDVDFEFDEHTAKATRSVSSFAQLILDLIREPSIKSK
jgi:acyl carrier protein